MACLNIIGVVGAVIVLSLPASAAVLGFVDDFAAPGTSGWTSLISNSNPGTGGIGGDGDGFLLLSSSVEFHFGTHNDTPNYQGNWSAAGITQLSFYLNDVGTDEPFSFHFLFTGGPTGQPETTWLRDASLEPPNGSWQQYVVDLTDGSGWTRVRGDATFAEVLAEVEDAQFRHDLPPYVASPDSIMGDLGIDQITLLPEPGSMLLLAVSLLLLPSRRRS
jgi:hypothetical protein